MFLVSDIGGTNTRVAVVREGEIGKIVKFKTPDNPQDGMEKWLQTAREITDGETPKAVCCGVAGPVDEEKGALMESPNLSGWVDFSIKEHLSEAFGGVQVVVKNDTSLVGLGEAWDGAGKGYEIVAYITVSTGVGGTRIVNGQLDEASLGFEPGHHVIDMSEFEYHQTEPHRVGSVPGHWEYFISGTGIGERHNQAPEDIKRPEVWEVFLRQLAIGLNNVAVFWSPDVIVLGGSMIVKNEFISEQSVSRAFSKALKIFPDAPPVRFAHLGDDGGIHGGKAYLEQGKK